MPKVKLYNTEGKAVGERKLSDAIFAVEVKPDVVHEVVVSLRASARQPVAHTKTRGEVRGGGKKPWRQKGTGRARHGSIRSPIWAGGGVTFGPRSTRDYTKKINRKLKRRAMFMALSDKVASDRLILVESLVSENGKTKEAAGLVGRLPVKGRVMLVTPSGDEQLARSIRNLPGIMYGNTNSLNLIDVLENDFVVMTPDAVKRLEEIYGAEAK
ncbi:50S ribosomal protein L4 [Parcubacteria bacterium SG8_24]|nr:MAG: 50S ribosomal protein L4 [Parcubacteria bacterium SG8_24]